MINNNEIKRLIQSIDAGKFQNMCNRILHKQGYTNINPLGSQDISDCTTPGTPDTFLIKNDEFICVEYTIQKTDLFNKINEDVQKCIKKFKECNINLGTIKYFYNTSNLQMQHVKRLKDLCKKEGYNLEIYNIDMIANELRENYPLIAKEFLGISIDTLQVIDPEDFLKEYNLAKSSVKINKRLLFREKEKEDIKKLLLDNDIVLITGKSGVGKTHIVIDMLINDKKEFKDYHILCIKNRNQDIFNDLKKYLNKGEKYILFIDDINNINSLNQILYFFEPINEINLKIIATVRDYVKNNVMKKINDIFSSTGKKYDIGVENINRLDDEQLTNILKEEVKIKNIHLIRNILKISNGNTRLMMMTADVLLSKDSKKKYSINEIYSIYYEKIIDQISDENPYIMKTLAVISILNAIDLNNSFHKELIKLFNLDINTFISDMKILNENELIDRIDENIAKVSEQCLANYSLCIAFIKEKNIKLSDFIILMFNKNKDRMIETINILTNVFYDKELINFLKLEVEKVWKNIDTNEIDCLSFLEVFAQPIETEAILYCLEYINNLEEQKIKLKFEDFNNEKNRNLTEDKIIKILSQFKYSNNMEMSLELLFKYVNKKNSIILNIYNMFINEWGLGEEILHYDFNIQRKIVTYIYNNLNDNENNQYLLLNIIKSFLKLSGSYNFYDKKRTITITNFNYAECPKLRKHRNYLLNILKDLYKNHNLKEYIEYIIYSLYNNEYKLNKDIKNILKNDQETLNSLLKLFDLKSFNSLLVIERIDSLYRKHEITFEELESDNFTFTIFLKLKRFISPRFKIEEENNKVKEFVKEIKENELKNILDSIDEIKKNKLLNNDSNLLRIINTFYNELFKKENIDICQILDYCIQKEYLDVGWTNYIIKTCLERYDYQQIKSVLKHHEYDSKFSFLLACHEQIPENQISKNELEELKALISEKNVISISPYINLCFLEKYTCIEKNVFPDVLKIIYKTYKNEKFMLNILTSSLFNEYNISPENLVDLFKEDYEILFDVYIELLNNNQNEDYEGKYFNALIKLNYKLFIDKYINNYLENIHYNSENYKLDYIWTEEEEKIEYLFNKIISINDNFKRSCLFENVFSKSNNIKEDKYIMKLIEEYKNNKEIISDIFFAISDKSEKLKIKYIIHFIKLNKDEKVFEKISIESHSWAWSGSEIPLFENRIKYISDLLKEVSNLGLDYIKHRLYLEQYKKDLETRKGKARIKEFFRD